MTGHASIDSAVEAMKLGAYDYLHKPIDSVRLEVLVEQALEDRKLQRRGRRAAPGAPAALRLPQPAGQEPPDARGLRPGGAGRLVVVHGPDHGRDRDRQGAGRPGDPLHRRHPARPAGRGQLRGPARAAPGERVLRPRAGGLHRGRPPEEGAVRAGQGGDAPPRRDRRAAAGDAGQAAPRPPGRDASSGSAAPRSSRPTAGSSPRPTSTWPRPSPPAGSARTCTTGSTSSRSSCPRSASGSRTSRCWSTTSSSGSQERRLPVKTVLARDPRRGWPATTGPATSASSSTSSSRWS